MKHIYKKAARLSLRVTLSLALFVVVMLALVHLGLIIAVSYLNEGKAQGQMQAYINQMMQGSGYNVTFDALSYYPARGLGLRNLKIYDQDGVFLTLDRASLTVDFSTLALHKLDVSLEAGTAALLRLPHNTATAQKSAQRESFSFPDVYFKNFEISSFTVRKFEIDPAIAGTALTFSPRLEARAALNGDLKIEAQLFPTPQTQISGIDLPDKIQLAGEFNPQTLGLKINDFSINAPTYTFKGDGTLFLVDEGTLNIRLKAAYGDLKAFTQGNFDSAAIDVIATGTLVQPEIKAIGNLRTASLKERGLDDIDFTVIPQGDLSESRADIQVTTQYLGNDAALNAVFTYSPGLIKLDEINATGPQIEATGHISLPLAALLPEGQVFIKAADLAYYKDLLQTEIGGALTTDISFKPHEDRLAVDVKALLSEGRYQSMHVSTLDLRTSLADITHPWPQAVDAKISALQVSPDISIKNATVNLKEAEDGVYDLSLTGSGTAPMPLSFKGTAELSQLSEILPHVGKIDFTTNLNKSSLKLTGEASAQDISLTLSTKNFSALDIPAALPETVKDILLSGEIKMTGNPAAPVTTAQISAEGFNAGKYKGLKITTDAHHQAGKATIALKGTGPGIKILRGDAVVPLTFALSPFAFEFSNNTSLSGDFMAELSLDALSPLFLPVTQSLSGALSTSGKVSGTMAAPDFNADITLRNCDFKDEAQGIELGEITGNALLDNTRLTISSLTATDNEAGRLNAEGTIGLSGQAGGSVTLSMKKFHLPKSQLANGHINADLIFERISTGLTAKGNVDIDEMNITIPKSFMSNIPELNIVRKEKQKSRSLATVLAIKVNAPNQVFLRGWGLDAEFGGGLDITGDASAPQFNGTLSSKRGRYEEFGKHFTLAHADLRFQGDVPPSPYLDVEATTPSGDITASILLSGPVIKPSISFSSTPALPQDEVLSRILFNKDSSKISPFQAIQLAQMIQRFAGKGGGGGFDPLGKLRTATGLDDISVDTDSAGQTNVGVGKYLSDKVYIEVEKGKAANSGNATIQIEMTPEINIQSEIGQDSQTGGGIFWKRDY